MKNIFPYDPSLAGVESEDQFNFKCKYCKRNLSSRQNLREHIYIHTGETPYVCTEPGCDQKFRQGSLLSIHRKVHAAINKNQKQKDKRKIPAGPLKLTLMLRNKNTKFEEELTDEEREEILTKIGDEKYKFALKYLSRLG
jgi:uncharacterized Zn-finger protein